MDNAAIPSEQSIYARIDEVFDRGIRRPGYPADEWATEHCRVLFEQLGLEDVRLEPVELPRWEPRSWSLDVNADSGDSLNIPCFPLPHSAPTEGLEAHIVPFDASDPTHVEGQIALYEVTLMRSRQAVLSALATSTFDPDGTFADSVQVLPFGSQIQAVMEPVIQAGAVGFVGVLNDYPSDSHDYYVPYDAVERPIPGVWIRGSDGKTLTAMLAGGPATARIEVDSIREPITTYNVVGELPGADEETVIIGSHHDGPWASAVEDGSGIALVLAQAEYWAKVPRSERPHRLLFLLNSGHMAGGAGAEAFIAAHKSELERTVLELHLEHAANECEEDEDGRLVPNGLPETRWWFTSRNPQLQQSVASAIEAEGLDRSLVIPPDAFGPRPTTDGGAFHLAGVPLVNYLTAPFYLFDSQDTMDKIHRPSLVAVTRAAIRIVESTGGVSAAEMRSAVATA